MKLTPSAVTNNSGEDKHSLYTEGTAFAWETRRDLQTSHISAKLSPEIWLFINYA